MALFKSQEEKDNDLLQKYGLENLNDPYTIKAVREMVDGLRGMKLFQAGYSLGLQGEKAIAMQLQKTQIDQNFIIIRQLDKLNQLLEK